MTGVGRRVLIASSVGLAAGAGSARAQSPYLSRILKLIVPFPPGGSNDIMGRTIAQELTNTLGQQVVVENWGGAGGSIGVVAVSRVASDGYTLLLVKNVSDNPCNTATQGTSHHG